MSNNTEYCWGGKLFLELLIVFSLQLKLEEAILCLGKDLNILVIHMRYWSDPLLAGGFPCHGYRLYIKFHRCSLKIHNLD